MNLINHQLKIYALAVMGSGIFMACAQTRKVTHSKTNAAQSKSGKIIPSQLKW
ncbi:hypothetical protein [Chryseobacterium carnipullorum]|uniref:Uncharacterized protein n=2 Tax=Chryseobacterium carnipullorum TaxID=1124835 RepID=A0A376DT79_CHRCU|nr:hypothetical protein [Chryseobacterium carnipullorum]STC94088.1 Uncharacterised protein [Chryseobacterium carnipullorum]